MPICRFCQKEFASIGDGDGAHDWFACSEKTVERFRSALKFVGDLASEELPHAQVGTGAEVALRHIVRRVNQTV